jgi:hypothetical protein
MGRSGRFITLLSILVFLFLTNLYAERGERRGAMFTFGLGAGHTTISSGINEFSTYSQFGLGVNMGAGWAPTNKSAFLLGINSNVFPGEVQTVWENWREKMQGDTFGALGAKIVSPFVFTFSPIFRSHSIYGSLEYTHFLQDEAPSFLIDGSAGFGLIYERNHEMVYGGFGLSAGAGYEFVNRVAVNFDIVYSKVEYEVSGITFLLTLKLYVY